MKLKVLLKLAEKVLGITSEDGCPRADMYLPERLLAMGLIMLAAGTALVLAFFLIGNPWVLGFALVCFGFGVMAMLCYKNQSIRVVSETQFEYTTFLGNTHTYSFRDIQGLRLNQDSMTLFVAGKKVHIESMAYISPRLADAINRELKRLSEQQAKNK